MGRVMAPIFAASGSYANTWNEASTRWTYFASWIRNWRSPTAGCMAQTTHKGGSRAHGMGGKRTYGSIWVPAWGRPAFAHGDRPRAGRCCS